MQPPPAPERRQRGFDMTPMIDVVFLLIIFFLVTSHLARQEVHLDLDLPQAQTGRTDDPEGERRLVINVLPEGALRIGGRPVDAEQLPDLLQRARDSGEEPVEIRIRSDRQVPYRFVEPILVACAKAGLWKVSFAVERADAK